MSDPATSSPVQFRTGALSPRKPTRFVYVPDAAARAALADALDLVSLDRLEFRGEIAPAGRDALILTGQLQAAAVQACVVTLAPIKVRIDESLRRHYLADLPPPSGDEIEMPEDEDKEPMPETIDLSVIVAEALALALPLYPRAPGAALGQALHAADGVAPIKDDDLKPFAGLAGLAERLSAKRPDDDA